MSRSPGWHLSTRHSASSVWKRIARALPVLRMDRLTGLMPMASASSLELILRLASSTSSSMRIDISDRQILLDLQAPAFVHDARHDDHDHADEQKFQVGEVEPERDLASADRIVPTQGDAIEHLINRVHHLRGDDGPAQPADDSHRVGRKDTPLLVQAEQARQ